MRRLPADTCHKCRAELQQGTRFDELAHNCAVWKFSNVCNRYHKHPVYRYLLQFEPDNPAGEFACVKFLGLRNCVKSVLSVLFRKTTRNCCWGHCSSRCTSLDPRRTAKDYGSKYVEHNMHKMICDQNCLAKPHLKDKTVGHLSQVKLKALTLNFRHRLIPDLKQEKRNGPGLKLGFAKLDNTNQINYSPLGCG